MAREKLDNRKDYYRLLGTVYIMVLFGLVMVLSASWVRAHTSTGDSYYYLKRQLVWVLLGSLMLLIFSRIPARRLREIAPYGIFVTIAMLVAVLIPGIGKSAGGASRWIPIGSFHLQPSELAKFAVVLYTADFLARKKGELYKVGDLVYPYGVVVGLIALLVMKQPDMGTTLAICMGAFALIFISGFKFRYVAGVGALGLAAGAYFISTASYRLKRFTAFLDPMADPLGAGYHIRQSLIAFGSGGLIGVGLGMSRQKYSYLPAAHTDFIFAIIGEELGLLGTLFTISLFAVFAYHGIRIAFRCKNTFGRLLAAGLTSMIILQALVNMGAVTAVLPITGIPMPFISYGGSSLMVNLASVGILLSLALESKGRVSLKVKMPGLYVVGNGDSSSRKVTRKKRSKPKSPNRGTAARSTRSKSANSSRSTNTRTAKSTVASKTKARGAKSNESNNKRGRNSGSHISGSSSRQGASKRKTRS